MAFVFATEILSNNLKVFNSVTSNPVIAFYGHSQASAMATTVRTEISCNKRCSTEV